MSIQKQGESGRLAVVAAVLVAFVAGAFVLVNELNIPSAGSTETTGMELVAVSGGSICPDGYCVPLGDKLVLGVDLIDPPAAGYIGAQTWIDYGTHLTYNETGTITDELVWADC